MFSSHHITITSINIPIPISGMNVGASSSLLLSNNSQLFHGLVSSGEDTTYVEMAAKGFMNISRNDNNNKTTKTFSNNSNSNMITRSRRRRSSYHHHYHQRCLN